jgi:uncharacterized paraquat-inducible protein A
VPRKRASHEYAGPVCPHCGAGLDVARMVSGLQACPACFGSFEGTRFQPPERQAVVQRLGESGPGAETACAAHSDNVAVVNCQRCGVFMCALCRIDADEMALCPACFDRLSAEGALASTRTTFRDYGRQASNTAIAGLLMWVFGLLIGPVAIYYGIRSLRQLRQMGETGGRARAVIAILAGLVETALGGFFVVSMVARA